MYEIAICEDEPVFSEALERLCREILDGLGAEYGVRVFADAIPFLKQFREQRFHLYLLDVRMDGMSGMELAHHIREMDAKGTIIFTTSSPEYALDGYAVRATRYLLKPVEKEVLQPLLQSDYRENYLARYVLLQDGTRKVRLPLDNIVYLETAGRRVRVCALSGPAGGERERTLYFSGKLQELLDQLPQDQFVRCHQGYAINIAKAAELDRLQVVTPLGNIPISRTYGPTVQKAYLRRL